MPEPRIDHVATGSAHPRQETLLRLRRAHGQLGGVISMVEAGRESSEVLVQLAAALHALHRASFRMVVEELERCYDDPDRRSSARTGELEKLFLALA
jgi:DNA-binding FrmR family transcriptional regulator